MGFCGYGNETDVIWKRDQDGMGMKSWEWDFVDMGMKLR